MIDEIKENNVVNFEVEMGMKGPTATNVKIYKEPIKPSTPKPVVDAPVVEASDSDTDKPEDKNDTAQYRFRENRSRKGKRIDRK